VNKGRREKPLRTNSPGRLAGVGFAVGNLGLTPTADVYRVDLVVIVDVVVGTEAVLARVGDPLAVW
jgi:hypothetical protein